MRRQHFLKRNAKNELPQYMIFVDTESKGVQINDTRQHHYLWFGWAKRIRARSRNGNETKTERWIRFTSANDFWRWVQDNAMDKTRTWIFAHNWNFDGGILNISRVLPALGYTLGKYINDKPPFIIRWYNGSHTLLLVDTLNYFAGSLASIGESIGIPKLEFPQGDQDQTVWDTYCRRDVEVLEKAVLAFRTLVDELDLGNFQTTLASQAFTAYRHRFMSHQILIHDKLDICKMEREGYYGGRTECFRVGYIEQRVYYLDINSMYPSVMRRNQFPTIIRGVVRSPCLEDVQGLLDRYCVVGDCLIDTKRPIFPQRIDGRLCFPTGRFRAVLTSPEIRLGIQLGAITYIRKLAYYEQADIFTKFIDELYQVRQKYRAEGNITFTYMVKILMNSLYGKFGQNGTQWEETGEKRDSFEGILYEQETPDEPIRKLRYRLGAVQEFKREGESENSFPAISAHVTAYGRIMLWELIEKAGRENVYYTDTDSLIVNQIGYDRLQDELDETVLGKLKLESVSSSCELYGPKDYRFGDTVRIKGVKRNAVQVAEKTWEQDMFRSWDYVISHGADGYIPIERVQKTLRREYKKGVVNPDGTITPFCLSEV